MKMSRRTSNERSTYKLIATVEYFWGHRPKYKKILFLVAFYLSKILTTRPLTFLRWIILAPMLFLKSQGILKVDSLFITESEIDVLFHEMTKAKILEHREFLRRRIKLIIEKAMTEEEFAVEG